MAKVLDSLIVGSSDPKVKALLKSPQTRTWTSFIEPSQPPDEPSPPELFSRAGNFKLNGSLMSLSSQKTGISSHRPMAGLITILVIPG
jgi:hypothetical protein